MRRFSLRIWWDEGDLDNVRVCRDLTGGRSQHLVETNTGLLQWRDHEPCASIESVPTPAFVAWIEQKGMRDNG